MYPVIVKIYGVPLYAYGLMMAVSFLICALLAARRAKTIGIAPKDIIDISLYILVSGIIGARLFYVFNNLSYYLKNPLEVFLLQKGGLVFYGGFFLALLTGFVVVRKRKLPLGETADLIVLYLPLGQAIARIGCFLNGCCYGKLTAACWAVKYPPASMATYRFGPDHLVHPVQLYSSLLNVVIFMILNIKKKKFAGELLFDYLVLYGLARFVLEMFRADNPAVVWGLSLFQLISLGLLTSGLVFGPLAGKYARKAL